MAIFSSVLRAFRALFTQIYYWALPSTVVDTSADVEKGINVTENQQRGTTHSHCFTADSALALNPSGDYGYLARTPFSPTMKLYRDDLSDDSYSSMPSLEWVGSMSSLDPFVTDQK
ncbi:hypothetical protein PILCRDRAFT_14000 [Piloderma croceum F 1598]|uniref:Uncharacterized protein n=1 Tax=Piloderma croceum (strain F 1598) TaxID=765440 RepID=A0A0C3F4V7_PILCF|nr:hypothetical protein PILCRDRAFT_14000 [Piloderma croceum F 1598]